MYKIEKMHKELSESYHRLRDLQCVELSMVSGPIVRINAHELRVSDPDIDFMDRLYRLEKKSIDSGGQQACLATMKCRSALLVTTFTTCVGCLKFFSSAYIRRLEPILENFVNNMIRNIAISIEARKRVNLVHAFSALTQDVITEYCFSSSRNVLEKENFAPHWYEWMQVHCKFTPM